ncbi:MAG: hypothetical protein QOG21_2111 [Actinomycetota bacterium]|nr:hypothetical protein [Actinomycetota bacterium]
MDCLYLIVPRMCRALPCFSLHGSPDLPGGSFLKARASASRLDAVVLTIDMAGVPCVHDTPGGGERYRGSCRRRQSMNRPVKDWLLDRMRPSGSVGLPSGTQPLMSITSTRLSVTSIMRVHSLAEKSEWISLER